MARALRSWNRRSSTSSVILRELRSVSNTTRYSVSAGPLPDSVTFTLMIGACADWSVTLAVKGNFKSHRDADAKPGKLQYATSMQRIQEMKSTGLSDSRFVTR